MDCETFQKGIWSFKSRPLLFNSFLYKHLKENPKCTCDIEYLKLENEDEIYTNRKPR